MAQDVGCVASAQQNRGAGVSLKLTKDTMYAWKAVAYLAAHQGDGRVLGSAIAEAVCVSYGVITPILRLLKGAGLVDSTKVGWGGYSLAKQPADITLLDVV